MSRGKIRALAKKGMDLIALEDSQIQTGYYKSMVNMEGQKSAAQQVGLQYIAGSLRDIHKVLQSDTENFKNDLKGIRDLLEEIKNLQREVT